MLSKWFCLRISSSRSDHFGVGINVEFFAAREQELLINQVAKEILLNLGRSFGACLETAIRSRLLLRTLIIAAVNDLIVNPERRDIRRPYRLG